MVLWTEAKEEVCQGNDTARRRSSTPYDRSKEARRSAKFVGRWEYLHRPFIGGSVGTADKDCTRFESYGNCEKRIAS